MKLPSDAEIAAGTPDRMRLAGFDYVAERRSGEFVLSQALLRHLENFGPVQKYWDAALIGETLETPSVVLEGLRRRNFEDAVCYCSAPSNRWVSDDLCEATPAGFVFAVYVKQVGDDKVVIDWDWRRESEDNPGVPRNWQRDFERIAWQAR